MEDNGGEPRDEVHDGWRRGNRKWAVAWDSKRVAVVGDK